MGSSFFVRNGHYVRIQVQGFQLIQITMFKNRVTTNVNKISSLEITDQHRKNDATLMMVLHCTFGRLSGSAVR